MEKGGVTVNVASMRRNYRRMLKDENPQRRKEGIEGIRRLDKYDENDRPENRTIFTINDIEIIYRESA